MGAIQAAAEERYCNPAVPKSWSDPKLAYRERGNRCEGLYSQQIAAPSKVEIVGFFQHPPVVEPGSEVPLRVKIGESNSPVQIQAVSLRYRHFYRMDTRLAPGQANFLWPRSILNSREVSLNKRELAILACISTCRSTGSRSMMKILPVSLTDERRNIKPKSYLMFRASVRLKSLWLRISRLPDREVLGQANVLGGRRLAAGEPFRVPVSALRYGSRYLLQVRAVPASSGASSSTVEAELVMVK